VKIAVLGAGSWGTALACVAVRQDDPNRRVTLWARDARQSAAMAQQRTNPRYLPGIQLPPALHIATGPLDESPSQPETPWLQEADLVVIATPVAGLRPMLAQLRDCRVPVAWLCKGFEPADSDSTRGGDSSSNGLMAHEIQALLAPQLIAGALSGPSFALEVAQGQPTALVASSPHAAVRDALVQAFHSPTLRVYANDDIVGVEVGGAVKNVLAIATGLCDGLSLGLNARAALITRGLAEMTRLGVALGARADTFMGLSGLGDLVLTATGDLSRNRKVGLLLAQGNTLQQAVDSLGHVAEGVFCARVVVQRAKSLGVDMPICSAVVALLNEQISPQQAVAALMGRVQTGE
jgi:glycerol-3-phosphate dehydrogenase (NAD(P)+)